MGVLATGATMLAGVHSQIDKAVINFSNSVMATDTSDVLSKIFTPIINFIKAIKNYVYVAAIIACLVVGIMFMCGERARQKAREYLPYIVAGFVIAVGCVTIGTAMKDAFVF